MTGWPAKPVIYEINTAIWLGDLSRAAGWQVTLADVPASAWDDVTPAGADAVWLMGVWERSPAGLELANANAGLQASFRDALPDVRRDDVIGSPYCVRRYVVDDSFGGPWALAEARAKLAARGVRLLLDHVPNHVAPDHPWVTTHPELLVNGDEADIEAEPAAWVRAAGHILAHGRDPYFPPWPDVVQLDAFSPALRAATVQTLSDIAGQCDGIRCDMAMLMTNQVFAKTWGGRTGQQPGEEFWPTVIAGLRSQHPETVLVAEAYWDMEWTLQQQGFDFCYDKRLYDRIVGRDVAGVRGHLRAELAYQSRLVRFLENHDEPRIAGLLPGDAERAAAVAIATLPGATLWHEGQFEGRRVRPPVFLSRRPGEPSDPPWPAGTGGCWPPWPATGYGRATGSCSRWPAGPTTIPAVTSSPGPGPLTARVAALLTTWLAAMAGTWWWSTSPPSPPMDGSGSAGSTCTAAAGTSPTCSMTGYTSGAATSWLTRDCSSRCRPGAAICSPCRDPCPRAAYHLLRRGPVRTDILRFPARLNSGSCRLLPLSFTPNCWQVHLRVGIPACAACFLIVNHP